MLLTQVATPDVNPTDAVNGVSWSPDRKYLAAVMDSGDTASMRIYLFDSGNATLTQVATATGLVTNYNYQDVGWAPTCDYIGLVQEVNGSDGTQILTFDRTTSQLSLTAVLTGVQFGRAHNFSWANDGIHFALGGSPGAIQNRVAIFEFDPDSSTIAGIASGNFFYNSGTATAKFSPSGSFVALGFRDAVSPAGAYALAMYEGLSFPSKNIIKDNVVYCNSGARCPRGFGIYGSSSENLIIQNTAYANPCMNKSSSGAVATNYAFVTNVFNQHFGIGPTALQNISVGCNQPICMPDDLSLILKQSLYKADMLSKIDVVGLLADDIDIMLTCTPIVILAVDIPTTINLSGAYCLAQDASAAATAITINADNVTLDLNNHAITSTAFIGSAIAINSYNNIEIKNGILIQNALINTGIAITNARWIHIKDLAIKGNNTSLSIGISLQAADEFTIDNVTVSKDTVGFSVSGGCANGVIKNSIASKCINIGFELTQTYTCCITDCKALSTGVANTQLDISGSIGGLCGFSSCGGANNIFERCIANATQGLTVTGSSSFVAGFRLGPDTNGIQEQCTKIIDCEAANAITNSDGETIPYGILLEATFDSLGSTTIVAADFSSTCTALAWSPDGKFLAVGGVGDDALAVYQFDYINPNLTKHASNTPIAHAEIRAVAWAPDGQYIAAVGGTGMDNLYLYKFIETNLSLTLLQTISPTSPLASNNMRSVNWSKDGEFIIVTGDLSDAVNIFRFNQNKQELSLFDSVALTGEGYAVTWSPDTIYYAVSLYQNDSNSVQIFKLNQVASIQEFTPGTLNDIIHSLAWSPDGKYLALGGDIDATDNVFIYRLDCSSTFSFIYATSINPGGIIMDVSWSSDSKYLSVCSETTSGNNLFVYEFDRGDPSLILKDSVQVGSSGDDVYAVSWSPDGQYIAAGGLITAPDLDLQIYSALYFPSNNVIAGNTVYCNSGAYCSLGIGISGSSIANMIIDNTAYANPTRAANEGKDTVAGFTNYAFATNVLEAQFGNVPTLVQNISVQPYEPFLYAENVAFLLKQDCAKVMGIGLCGPMAITSADIFGGTISLTQSGNYCLGENITADVIISTTCISFDLNDHCLMGEITVQTAQNVVIQNGKIQSLSDSGLSPLGSIDIASTVLGALIQNVQISTYDATASSNAGRHGITTAGHEIIIRDCSIDTGDGFAAAAAADGGTGIRVEDDSQRVIINNCVISSGNGATGTTPGNGGHGIHVLGANKVEIVNCLIEQTGAGGDDTDTAAGGGDGGNGILIDSTAVDVAAANNIIRNTGAAGSGTSTSTGVAGKAVDDNVAAGANGSQIFSNFAHNIANSINFDLQAAGSESGVMTPNPPTTTPVNSFANVYS